MRFKKLFFLVFFILSLYVFFYAKKHFAQEYGYDPTPPDITIDVTCAGNAVADGGRCNASLASISIRYEEPDAGSGLATISHVITGDDAHNATSAAASSNPYTYNSYTASNTTSSYTIMVNATNTTGVQGNANFTFRFTYSITGNVIVDYNHDCNTNGSDANYSGTPILTSTSGTVSPSAGGTYSVTDLDYGDSPTVTLTAPSGYQLSSCNSSPYAPGSIVSSIPHDFYISPLYTISGNVFIDANKDQLKNSGEQPYTSTSSTIEVHYGTDVACSPSTLVSAVGTGGIITTNTGTFNTDSSGGDKNLLSGTYTLCYTNKPNTFLMTYPLTGTPPSFTVTVGKPGTIPACSTGTLLNASCDANGNASELDFGISNSIPWYQCVGGDCRFDSGINNPISSNPTCRPNNPYASIPATSDGTDNGTVSSDPGILFPGNNSYYFCVDGPCLDRASQSRRVTSGSFNAQNPNVTRTSYQAMITTMRQSGITAIDLSTVCADLTNCVLPHDLPNGIYTASSSLTISGINSSSPANTLDNDKRIIILVDGNLTINSEVHVPISSSFTFSASNNIIIGANIGVAANSTSYAPQIEGFYSADASFIIEGNNNCTIGPDKRLNIAGSVIARANQNISGSITNNRDLCIYNLDCPTYTITARPDFLLNAPEFIKHPNYIWKEVAP